MYATLTRSKYVDSGRFVLAEFKDIFKKYRDLIQPASLGSPSLGGSNIKEQLTLVEMQLTWMVYMVSALIGGRIVSLWQDAARLCTCIPMRCHH
jgi:exportin-7